MGLGIFQAGRRYQVAACAVPGQNDLVRVDAQLFCVVKGVSNDTVRLLDCCRKRLFRCKAVVHIPDKAVQLLHQGAAIAAVTVGAALDEAAAVEIEDQCCLFRQMVRSLLVDMDGTPALYGDVQLGLRAGQGGQLFRADRAKAVPAADGLRHRDLFFQHHTACSFLRIRMPGKPSWYRRCR